MASSQSNYNYQHLAYPVDGASLRMPLLSGVGLCILWQWRRGGTRDVFDSFAENSVAVELPVVPVDARIPYVKG